MKKLGALFLAVLFLLLCACNGKSSGESAGQVQFGEKLIDSGNLSQETLEWLEWYNSLPQEEQQAVSAIPHDLYDELDYPDTQDAEAPVPEEKTDQEEMP